MTVYQQYREKMEAIKKKHLEELVNPSVVECGSGPQVELTAEMIEAGMSAGGTLTAEQLRLLGVVGPLTAGWRERLVGRKVSASRMEMFLTMKGGGPLVELTGKMVYKGKSHKGGWSERQLQLIGVDWPPRKGWKQQAVGRLIPASAYRMFLSLANKPAQVGDTFRAGTEIPGATDGHEGTRPAGTPHGD